MSDPINSNVVKKTIYATRYNDESSALQLQDDISKIHGRRLTRTIDRILNKASGEDYYQFDRVEVDLGIVHRGDLPNKMESRLEEALLEVLLQEINGKPGSDFKRSTPRLIEALRSLLLSGVMPWWMKGKSSDLAQDVIQRCLNEHKEELVSLLKEIGTKPGVIERLALMEETQKEQVVAALEPVESSFIISYTSQLQSVNKKQSLFQGGHNKLNKELWALVFDYLLNDRGSVFNRKSFIANQLEAIAKRYAISYESLLDKLASILTTSLTSSTFNSSLPLLIQTIYLDRKKRKLRESSSEASDAYNAELLLHKGYLPAASHLSLQQFESTINQLLFHSRDRIITWLSSSVIRRRMANLLRSSSLKRMLKQVYGADITLIEQTGKELTQLLQSPDILRRKEFETELLTQALHYLSKPTTSKSKSGLQLYLWQQMALHLPPISNDQMHLIDEKPWTAARKKEIKQLYREASVKTQAETGLDPETALANIAALRAFLTTGKAPWWIEAKSKQKLQAIFQQLLTSHPQVVRELLKSPLDPIHYDALRQLAALPSPLFNLLLSTLGLAKELSFKKINALFTLPATYQRESVKYWDLFLKNTLLSVLIARGKLQTSELITSITLAIAEVDSDFDLNHLIESLLGKSSADAASLKKQLKPLLKTGRKRGSGLAQKDRRHFSDFTLEEKAIRLSAKEVRGYVRALVSHDTFGTFRILSTAEPKVAEMVLAQAKTSELIKLLRGLAAVRTPHLMAHLRIYLIMAGNIPEPLREKVLRKWILLLTRSSTQITSAGLTQILTNVIKNTNRDELVTEMLHRVKSKSSLTLLDEQILAEIKRTIMDAAFSGPGRDEEIATNEWEKASETEADFPAVTDEFFIENAGAVILWPHLKKLFETASLLKNGTLPDEAKHKAINLLQYLVVGEDEYFEYHLVLNKLLCGLPIEKIADRHVKLTTADKQNCEDLLKAVCSQWPPLKNTSIQGLRESFLQRPAKLTLMEEKWELVVEQKAYDMLLDKLPWAINHIKLSWMKLPLQVQWYQ